MKSLHVSKFQHRNPFLKNLENILEDWSKRKHSRSVILKSVVPENVNGVLR